MASSIFVTGSVDVWAAVADGVSPAFIGYGEEAPDVEEIHYWRPVKTDLSGGQGGPPQTKIYLGFDARITVTLAWYNWPNLQKLLARPNTRQNLRGVNSFGDRGSLMVEQGLTFPLWLNFPQAALPQNVALGMPRGYQFLACEVESPDRFKMGVDKPLEPSLVLYAYSVLNPVSLGFSCYVLDVSALTNLTRG